MVTIKFDYCKQAKQTNEDVAQFTKGKLGVRV
jgi:hypothetical protein